MESSAGQFLSLKAVFSLIMPESYVGLPSMDVDTKEKEQEKKRTAQVELKEFIEVIQQKKMGTNEKPWGWRKIKRGPIPSFFSGPVGGFFEHILIKDKPFHVESNRCVNAEYVRMSVLSMILKED